MKYQADNDLYSDVEKKEDPHSNNPWINSTNHRYI